jgi:cytochrome c553
VLVVPRVAGDVDKGKTVFHRRCAGCHGPSGQGKIDFPRLTGQWPNYLQRQFEKMKAGERPHEGESSMTDVLKRVKPEELNDILAWLTAIQTQPPDAEPDAGTL